MMYTASACNLGETGEKDCLENHFSYIGNSNEDKTICKGLSCDAILQEGLWSGFVSRSKEFHTTVLLMIILIPAYVVVVFQVLR